MKTKKKNSFFTFIFSLLPGAAEMYMGFMKTGLSLMLLFFSIIIVCICINQGVVAFFAVVAWFYSFFHANHLASLNDEEFDQVRDEYLFGLDSLPGIETFVKKYNRFIAYALIFIGVCFLWDSVAKLLYHLLPDEYYFIYQVFRRIGNYAPSVIIGIGIIFLGIKMLSGKKMDMETVDTGKEDAAERETADYLADAREGDK